MGYGLCGGEEVFVVRLGVGWLLGCAVATGRAVTEFEKNGKAASEVRELWGWIKRNIGEGHKK